jgi:hypothetical protein
VGADVSNLYDVRTEIAGKLTAAGVERVTLDRGQVAPSVFVGLPTGTGENVGIGAWRCEYPVTVVYLAPGDDNAARWALDQLELILRTLGLGAFRPVSFGEEQAPAYQVIVRRDVPNPDC